MPDGTIRIAGSRVSLESVVYHYRHGATAEEIAQRFPYRIFYIVRSDAIVVFAVLHAARHDRNWKLRVVSAAT